MSDTPRTEVYVLNPLPQVVSADWARQLERELDAAKARVARLEEALNQCDWGFTKHCPDEWSTNGQSWKAVREALGRPNPWEKSTP